MKAIAKSIVYNTAASVLHPSLLYRFNTANLTILMYHGVVESPLIIPDPCMVLLEDFTDQMMYLRRHFDVVPLSEGLRDCREGTSFSSSGPFAVSSFDGVKNTLASMRSIL